jgi:hypothetical protein
MSDTLRSCVFTSCNYGYFHKARLLLKSIRRTSDVDFFFMISDRPHAEAEDIVAKSANSHIVYTSRLGIPGFDQWVYRHNVVELCTAVKASCAKYLMGQGYDRVIYLDPDTYLFGDFSVISERICADSSIYLTPHVLKPARFTDPITVGDCELSSLKHGLYNLGFFALVKSEASNRFVEWWESRLLHYCKEDVPSGIFTDQKWCDFVPIFFDRVVIIREPGWNVASWNLQERELGVAKDGSLTINRDYPLVFFHFTKLGEVGLQMLSRYSSNCIPLELWSGYEAEYIEYVVECSFEGHLNYDFYSDGAAVQR